MTTMNSNEREDELVAEMSTVAANLVREWRSESEDDQELVEEFTVTLTHAHARAEANAATQMRDQCVAKVKTMKAEYDSKWQEVAHPEKGGAITSQSWQHYSNAANEIITALESLTLDVEQKS